jgi:putative sigma-54 modulation protein
MDKIERQLRRYKERLKHHHGRHNVHHNENALGRMKARHNVVEFHLPEQEAHSVAELAPLPASAPRVVETSDLEVRLMTVDEAAMQMDLMNADFLVFQNADTRELNVLYRRKVDGTFGLIETHAPPAALLAAAP